jgi:choline-sulfatase
MARQLVERRRLLEAAALTLTAAPAILSQARRQPNILFLFPDQFRHDFAGAGPRIPCQTPVFDRLARSGVRFTRAMAPSPLCAPSRACLASGREYHRCGVRSNAQDYPLEQPTIYHGLRDAGYHVLGCGKFDLHKATLDWGIDGRRFLPEWGFTDGIDNAGKFDAIASGAVEPRDPYMALLHRRGLAAMHVEDFRRRAQQASYLYTAPTPLPDDVYCDNWIAANAVDLLRKAPAGRPWFLQVNFAGPHNPVDITRRMERATRNRKFPQPVDSDQYTPFRHNTIRENYAAMVENIDRLCGLILEEVRRRGESAQTLVVFSSDHGEMLGDHELWGKGVPYHQSVGVPLAVSGPGVARGVVSDALVSLIDVTATLADFGGARMGDMDGVSLRPLLAGAAKPVRDVVRSSLGAWKMVFDGRYKLIRGFDPQPAPPRAKTRGTNGEPRPLLFDLKLDPDENTNLARQAPQQVERLSKLLL